MTPTHLQYLERIFIKKASQIRPHLWMNFIYFVMLVCLAGTQAHAEPEGTVTWDLGVASGKYQSSNAPYPDITFTEGDVGLNWFFIDYVAWRNAVFVRFPTGEKTVEGIDSGLRLQSRIDFGARSGLNLFTGAGFRFENLGGNVPFGEIGLSVQVSGLTIGGGAKVFFEKLINASTPTYVQYFIILSGSGVL
jgi:hypothetical protein